MHTQQPVAVPEAPISPHEAQPQAEDAQVAADHSANAAEGHDPQYLPSTVLWTPEIEKKVATSIEWIVSDMRGGLLKGLPLVGKSHFLIYAKQVIPPLLGGAVSIQHWSFLSYAGGGADEVLRLLMLQSGCRAVNARSPATLHIRLIDHLAERADAVGATRIVMLVDELQRLPAELYPVLMSVTSTLETGRFRPCVISMAQIEMQDQVDDFHEQAKLQVIGRFFAGVETFEALSVEDAIETMKNLEGGNGHFTSRWLPHLHERGWSLEKLGPPLRESMKRLQTEMGLSRPLLLPFNYLRPAMKFMFRMLVHVPECVGGLNADHVYECLRRSGYFPVAQHYVQTEAGQ
jgi:hypothetical protein